MNFTNFTNFTNLMNFTNFTNFTNFYNLLRAILKLIFPFLEENAYFCIVEARLRSA